MKKFTKAEIAAISRKIIAEVKAPIIEKNNKAKEVALKAFWKTALGKAIAKVDEIRPGTVPGHTIHQLISDSVKLAPLPYVSISEVEDEIILDSLEEVSVPDLVKKLVEKFKNKE